MLGSKLNHSYLLSLSRKSFGKKLQKEYNYTVNKEVVNWLYTIADSSFRAGNPAPRNYNAPGNWVFAFADNRISTDDFLKKATDLSSQVTTDNAVKFIDAILDNYSYEQLINYEDSQLEKKYPEFRYLVNEFHDGMLLFEISDSMVWSRAEMDSSGMRKYYESRIDEFTSPESATGTIYSISLETGKRSIRKLTRAIKRGASDQDISEAIERYAVAGSDTLISTTDGTWVRKENNIIDNIKWSKGYHQYKDNRYHYLVWFSHFNEGEILPYEEVRDIIINDYTELLAERWIKQLKSSYSVTVNRGLLNRIKQNSELR